MTMVTNTDTSMVINIKDQKNPSMNISQKVFTYTILRTPTLFNPTISLTTITIIITGR